MVITACITYLLSCLFVFVFVWLLLDLLLMLLSVFNCGLFTVMLINVYVRIKGALLC